jgi:hypothetical protein
VRPAVDGLLHPLYYVSSRHTGIRGKVEKVRVINIEECCEVNVVA